METKTFGDKLKETRLSFNLSVKELANLSEVSTTYISKMENNKRGYPTKETILNLASGFRKKLSEEEEMSDLINDLSMQIYLDFLMVEDSPYKNINFIEALEEFDKFYIIKLENSLKKLTSLNQEIFLNQIQLSTKKFEFEALDKPYFDIKWLLSQKDYEVFYGRSLILNNLESKQHLEEKDMFFYNILSSEDKKLIYEIIDLLLENKYESIDNDLEFFKKATNKDNFITNILYK